MEPIRIFIVDDHSIVLEGLPPLLEHSPDLKVVAKAANACIALEMGPTVDPDVILLDLSMPRMSGLEALPLFRRAWPRAKILIYTMHEKEAYVQQVFRNGAVGYVLKGTPVAELIDAIRTIHQGQYYLSSRLNPDVVQGFLKIRRQEPDAMGRYLLLSEREKQVFRLLLDGKTTAQIGEALFVSPKTAEKHRMAVMRKLEVKNLVEMLKLAVRIGLVDPESWHG